MLSKKEVEHVAKLARIRLSPEEIEKMREELSSILDYFEKLKEVDIEGVLPTTHSIKLRNVMRKDVILKKDPTISEKLIDLGPEKKGRHIKIKPVF